MVRSYSVFPLLLSLALLASCGYKEVEVKNFRLYFNSQDAGLVREAKRLTQYYNQRAGSEVLHIAETADGANSNVIWTKGLQTQDGKIGYGAWQAESKQDSPLVNLEGRKAKRKVKYSMSLEFDYDFFVQRMSGAQTSPQWQELFVLFSHEVGHGLTMSHDEDKKSVMYKYVDGADGVKFDEYFARVRAFFD